MLKYLSERGVRTARHKSEPEIDRAVQLHREGLSRAAIGRQLGFDGKTITKELRGRGRVR
ncbi:hypothetical protein GCM10009808_04890 [Microbacterium sediminicola]|uniref:Helix-turn-helix domain-containing protein n=1 Tax=Microbacterium sediminicola TaxID=415210 RepID=A0ABN2HP70_9MICO